MGLRLGKLCRVHNHFGTRLCSSIIKAVLNLIVDFANDLDLSRRQQSNLHSHFYENIPTILLEGVCRKWKDRF
jgi:hypothetical protein